MKFHYVRYFAPVLAVLLFAGCAGKTGSASTSAESGMTTAALPQISESASAESSQLQTTETVPVESSQLQTTEIPSADPSQEQMQQTGNATFHAPTETVETTAAH